MKRDTIIVLLFEGLLIAGVILGVNAVASKYDKKHDKTHIQTQIDSLQNVVNSLTIECQKLNDTIEYKDSLISTYQFKEKEYKELVNDYKAILEDMIGEDGINHYWEIDYD